MTRATRKLVQASRKKTTAVGRNNIWRTLQTVRQEVILVEPAGKKATTKLFVGVGEKSNKLTLPMTTV